jgi:two-component system sensor histidine kinase KdpD
MDVSYSEHHGIHLNLTYFSPILAIDNILKFIHSLLTKQKIIINLSHDLSDDFLIYNDINVFKRIFINIIGNATKYCPHYTKVNIQISLSSDSNLLISVKDNGHGFPQTVIDNFGVPFNVGDNFLTDTNNSIGLGLSIIKTSIQAMGGTVSIYNHAEGGAAMSFIIHQNIADISQNDDKHFTAKQA